jgi:hypothetical protein
VWCRNMPPPACSCTEALALTSRRRGVSAVAAVRQKSGDIHAAGAYARICSRRYVIVVTEHASAAMLPILRRATLVF